MAPKSGLKKIFITGGHYTPARAVIDRLKGWEIYYVGRKYSMEDSRALALEYQELKHLNYLCITTGRLQRKFFVNVGQSVRSLLKIPIGFLQSFWWLLWYRPNVVLSFGGYVALPVVISAWILDIPVMTHEQTKVIGLANRIIRLFGAKLLNVGNPLREEILGVKTSQTNTIFVTGGNQGSRVINQVIKESVSELTKKYKIIHQTGDVEGFSGTKIKNYEVKKFLSAGEMAQCLASAKIIISRAGANIVEEIAFLGKPSILIPLPWSGGGEQEKNAQTLVNFGMAEIIYQDVLSKETLLAKIDKIEKNYSQYLTNAKKGKTLVNPLAAEEIVKEVEKLVNETKQ